MQALGTTEFCATERGDSGTPLLGMLVDEIDQKSPISAVSGIDTEIEMF